MNGSFKRRRRENVFRDSYDAAAETQRESKSQRGGEQEREGLRIVFSTRRLLKGASPLPSPRSRASERRREKGERAPPSILIHFQGAIA